MKIKKKSQLTGILLSFFLGPFGLFYSMGWKALIVLIVWVFLSTSGSQELFILMPISSVILSLLAVRAYNNRVESDVFDILNEQAEAEMLEGLKVEETRLKNEEVEKARLNAERTRLERERESVWRLKEKDSEQKRLDLKKYSMQPTVLPAERSRLANSKSALSRRPRSATIAVLH
ncbi:MAG: hypothetical protein OXF50_18895 [Caldilineaceae bacterium]|nr:hypothetical protein [Caldilineaceae bacterium]